MENNNSPVETPVIVKPLEAAPTGKPPVFFIIAGLVIILLGIISGFFLSKSTGKVTTVGGKPVETIKTTTEEGVTNLALFPDEAVGTIKVNDKKITDEGSHILVRDGIGQNAYLTSSVVDLDKYIDKKVQVWGKTYSAQKAGWLMDIGRIKLVQ
ncbi:MAG: hypothetical protein AAB506_02515 [Patescibacteria group bacterium]